MTNILATLAFVVVTNWTGAVHDGREIGYTVTNHVATLVYAGKTNTMTLGSELGCLVTRPNTFTKATGDRMYIGELPIWDGIFIRTNVPGWNLKP